MGSLLKDRKVVVLIVLLSLCAMLLRVGWVLGGPEVDPDALAQESCSKIQTFTGEGSQQTQPFQTTGGSFRLDYSLQSNTQVQGASALDIFVYKASDNSLVDVVTLENPGKDSSFENEGAGSYYLKINSANGTWTVTALDCGGTGSGGQYQEGPSQKGGSTQGSSGAQQYEATQSGGSSLMESGGPKDGPVPHLPSGGCPDEFPVDKGDACSGIGVH